VGFLRGQSAIIPANFLLRRMSGIGSSKSPHAEPHKLQRSIENCIVALTDRAGTKGPFCSICALLAQNLSQRSKNLQHQYYQVIDMLIFY
jgi:hypothetical protein